MKKKKKPATYEGEVLAVLAFEFDFSDRAESERKIKRHLRDKKLGPYDQDRIDILRRFKDDLRKELGKCNRSQFYTGFHGKYADMLDWDFGALLHPCRKSTQMCPRKKSTVSCRMLSSCTI